MVKKCLAKIKTAKKERERPFFLYIFFGHSKEKYFTQKKKDILLVNRNKGFLFLVSNTKNLILTKLVFYVKFKTGEPKWEIQHKKDLMKLKKR